MRSTIGSTIGSTFLVRSTIGSTIGSTFGSTIGSTFLVRFDDVFQVQRIVVTVTYLFSLSPF